MHKKESILKLGLVLFLICALVTLALAAANYITAPKIAAITEKQEKEARAEVLFGADDFEKLSDKVYRGVKDGKTVGYAVNTNPSGFGGEINMMVGLDETFQVYGVKIVSFSETPGLGSKASEPKFLDQFKGKGADVCVVKGGAKNSNEVVAVSGATISSKAVTAGVTDAIKLAKEAGGAKE